jgi:hypothetical protein
MLARLNLQPTSGKSWFTTRGQREFEHLPLPTIPSRLREDYRALLPMLDAQIRQLDCEITQRWGDDPRVRRLCTIPGIGPFIATVLVLELGDIARFAHAKQVASDAGLTPRVRASADRIRSGHITKEGHRLLRGVLVLAATQAVRRPGPLRTWFHAVKQRARPEPRARGVGPAPGGNRLSRLYAHLLAEEKRRRPGPDIMSILLAQVDDDGGQVSVEEFENMFWLFAVAGNETLRNGLPGACIGLLDSPSVQDELRADPWSRSCCAGGPR